MCLKCSTEKVDHSGGRKSFGLVDKSCAFCESIMHGVGPRRLYCDTCQGTQSWRQMKSRYGLDMAGYKKLLEDQNGVCKICGRPETERSHLSVDHCHESGKIRGLLCNRCNTSIGKFEDNPELLRKAAAYLETFMG